MSLLGGVFGPSTSDVSSSTSYPPWYESAAQQAIGMAGKIARQPYQRYGGPRVAPFTQAQRGAMATTRRAGDIAVRAQGMTRDVYDTGWDAKAAGRYMNPFVSKAIAPAIRTINEAAAVDAIGTRAGMIGQGGRGAFGDARTGILETGIEEARLRGVGDVAARGYAQAYESGRSAFEAEQNRRLAAAGQYGTQAGRQAQIAAQHFGMGTAEQRADQAQMDVDYADFIEQRDWKQSRLAPLLAALGAVRIPSTTESQTPGTSIGQQAGGLGLATAALASMYFGGG